MAAGRGGARVKIHGAGRGRARNQVGPFLVILGRGKTSFGTGLVYTKHHKSAKLSSGLGEQTLLDQIIFLQRL